MTGAASSGAQLCLPVLVPEAGCSVQRLLQRGGPGCIAAAMDGLWACRGPKVRDTQGLSSNPGASDLASEEELLCNLQA